FTMSHHGTTDSFVAWCIDLFDYISGGTPPVTNPIDYATSPSPIPTAALARLQSLFDAVYDTAVFETGVNHDASAAFQAAIWDSVYDTDGDGRITQAEIDAVRADQHGRFDSDDDGALTLEEYEALWLDAMRERMVRRFQRHDRDGDGRVTTEEYGREMRNLVERRDRNGDGVLSREDVGPRRRANPSPSAPEAPEPEAETDL
ncbi:MAG: hypothetical protein AAFZ09_03645, partial [Pseudomonadota bacterium]